MLEILYRDDRYIAINKPAGLLVHRSNIDRQESRFAVQLLRDQIGQRVYPVHRLDRPTSGVLLFALDREAAQKAGALFSLHTIEKRYLAVVRGYTQDHGTIDYALAPKHDPYVCTGPETSEAQDAQTHYHLLARSELPVAVGRYATARYSLLMLTPVTGRRHQLRRHLKHIFHPIIGDTSHGDGRHNRMFRERFGSRQLLLVSVKLNLRHPFTHTRLDIVAPPGPAFETVAQHMGWDLSDCLVTVKNT